MKYLVLVSVTLLTLASSSFAKEMYWDKNGMCKCCDAGKNFGDPPTNCGDLVSCTSSCSGARKLVPQPLEAVGHDIRPAAGLTVHQAGPQKPIQAVPSKPAAVRSH